MTRSDALALGLDFGTESVRALLVDLDGREHGSATQAYRHGQITSIIPGTSISLPPRAALQHPDDWLESASVATRSALRSAGANASRVISIGVDCTSCTMLPVRADGTPLCREREFRERRHAWPKLWKHHGAVDATARINEMARRKRVRWLKRYGGTIGLEWLLPKILECVQDDRGVHDAADLWLEAGDWIVWRLVGGVAPVRSTCQAGYKACWSADTKSNRGYPAKAFLRALDPALEDLATTKLAGEHHAPGQRAGELGAEASRWFGLQEGTPVSVAIIDAHAAVPGAGVSGAGTLVMVLGTSSCHMINGRDLKDVEGVAGIVRDGILPGYVGYETGQAAVGDAFAWLSELTGTPTTDLDARAMRLDPGADGVRCVDWMNGCRTPLMDGRLGGMFAGLRLHHRPAHLHRALMEATGFGVRWIVEVLTDGGVPVRKLVATGGLAHHAPGLVQIYADILGRPIVVHPSRQGPALGAAILGVLAAGKSQTGFANAPAAIKAMASAGPDAATYAPDRKHGRLYDAVYEDYRDLADDEEARRGEA